MASSTPARPLTPTKRPLHILCFGDSLTEGYSQWGMVMTPYSRTLRNILEKRLNAYGRSEGEKEGKEGEKWNVKVETDGVSGELVTKYFLRRMESQYIDQEETSYDWVIFLGGTNDLGWGCSVKEIWDMISSITSIPLRHQANVLMLTVPECGVVNERLDAKRNELNALIKGDDREGIYVLDLHEKVPYHSMGEEERKEIWDDGLHFTPKGYERIGNLVAEKLFDVLSNKKS